MMTESCALMEEFLEQAIGEIASSERYEAFQRGALTQHVTALSTKEILAVFLSDDHLGKLDLFENERVYEWGVVSSQDMSYTLAFTGMYLQTEFFSEVRRGIDAAKSAISKGEICL